MTNEELLEAFYAKYYRAPSLDEFIAIGGKGYTARHKYGTYGSFLKEYGYEVLKRPITYEAYDLQGNFIFSGTKEDVAEELETSVCNIAKAVKHNRKIKRKYKIVRKEFDGL